MENVKKNPKTTVSEFVKKYDKALVALGALGLGAVCVLDPVVGAALGPALASVGVANTLLSFGKNAQLAKATANGAAEQAESVQNTNEEHATEKARLERHAQGGAIRVVGYTKPMRAVAGRASVGDRSTELVRVSASDAVERLATGYKAGCYDRDIVYELGIKTLSEAACGNLGGCEPEYTMGM